MKDGLARSVLDRMVRAAKLDESLYEEVEADKSATVQAGMVVAGTSLAAGIGGGLAYGALGLVVGTIAALGAWWLYAWVTYVIGTKLLKGPETQADQAEVARVLGFASTPRALLVFSGLAAPIGDLLILAVGVWLFLATVVAIRAALDFSTGRAVATAIAGSIAQSAIYYVVIALQS